MYFKIYFVLYILILIYSYINIYILIYSYKYMYMGEVCKWIRTAITTLALQTTPSSSRPSRCASLRLPLRTCGSSTGCWGTPSPWWPWWTTPTARPSWAPCPPTPSRSSSIFITHHQGRTGGIKWPGSSCPTGPLDPRRVASHVSVAYLEIYTHTQNIILDDYKEITSYMLFLITFGSTNFKVGDFPNTSEDF